MKIGGSFKTYNELVSRIERLEKATNTVFYRRISDKLDSAKPKKVKREFEPEIEFYSLVYWFNEGGRNVKNKEEGRRKTG